jgi:type II secretory pathway component PulF
VSNAFQTQTLAIVLGTIVFVLAVIWLPRFKFLKPYTHPIVLKIPVIKNVVKNYNLALFCRTFGTLLQSGLLIDEALSITSNVLKNQPYKKLLKNSIKEINKGVTLGDSLEARKDLFPPIVTRMIAVGERSGRLDETLLYLATFYETQVDLAIKGLTTSLEPMLLIAIGFVVAVVALSIITPIYKITGSIGR